MKKLLLLWCILMSSARCFSCTTFLLERNGRYVFGRNYDWITGTGMVHTNLRGINKHSLAIDGEETLKWTSRYGSVSFNQYGKEFPTGGLNEEGLVVELMWLANTRYPKPDSRPGVAVLQWVQYQLDRSRTIDEVIDSERLMRIAETGAPLHFLVADASGAAATIEFLNGQMVVHRAKTLPYPVLTNSTYQSSLAGLKDKQAERDNSIQRFSTACTMVQAFKKLESVDLVNYSFEVLSNVSQGNFTKWTIVYDITNKEIFFKTNDHPTIKQVKLRSLSFNCDQPALAANIDQARSGNICSYLLPYNDGLNTSVMTRAFKESSSQININEQLIKRASEIPTSYLCNKQTKAVGLR